MAWEELFRSPLVLNRFDESPLISQMDGFYQWLNEQGFARETIRNHISRLSYFSRYLKQLRINFTDLNSEHIQNFLSNYLPQCRFRRLVKNQHRKVASSINRFMEYLHEYNLVELPSNSAPYQSLLNEYTSWLQDYHNSAPGTVLLRRQYLTRFLNWLGTDWRPDRLLALSPNQIQSFFLEYSRHYGSSGRRSLQATLRTFFRFCFSKGYIDRDLSHSVPTLRTYKLDRLPRGITDEEAQRILSNINRQTDTGRRDYAIIQILYTYGIRGGQVRALHLDDIDWHQSRIRFAPLKHGKEVLQPLIDEVGTSILDYLQNSRPETAYPHVFLTIHAPCRPLRYSTTLSEIIRRNIRGAGIISSPAGSNVFRHCFASRMLEQGHSLKSIADMIGHRCIHTTFIYTKIDFRALNPVALEWPEEVT